jgi:hypothetical protein
MVGYSYTLRSNLLKNLNKTNILSTGKTINKKVLMLVLTNLFYRTSRLKVLLCTVVLYFDSFSFEKETLRTASGLDYPHGGKFSPILFSRILALILTETDRFGVLPSLPPIDKFFGKIYYESVIRYGFAY